MVHTVICTFDVIGFHHWPDAPEEVSYLRDPHRHLFNFRVEVPVTHPDRDIEFHMLKKLCMSKLASIAVETREALISTFDFGAKSCETIAKDLGDALFISNVYPRFIEVWEDRENGARVDFGGVL